MGLSVGLKEGDIVGSSVGSTEGYSEGKCEGKLLGPKVGSKLGFDEGANVGFDSKTKTHYFANSASKFIKRLTFSTTENIISKSVTRDVKFKRCLMRSFLFPLHHFVYVCVICSRMLVRWKAMT